MRGSPVAIGLFAILHFVPDDDDPAGIVACLRDAVAPGSYLVPKHQWRPPIGGPRPIPPTSSGER